MIALLITHFFALALPGADFILIIRTSLKNGFKNAVMVAFGISFGVFCWVVFVAFGLKKLLLSFPTLSNFLTIFSALYLFYLSFLILKTAGKTDLSQKTKSGKNYFLLGLITNLANPKAVFYFISIFSSYINQQNLTQISIITALIVLETLIFFIALGKIFSHEATIKLFYRYNKFVDYFCAFIFFVFANLILFGG